MITCTLTTNNNLPILKPGVEVVSYPSLVAENRTDTGICLGHYPYNSRRTTNGEPIKKHLAVKTISVQDGLIHNLINTSENPTRMRLVECGNVPNDKDIFLIVKLGCSNTGVIYSSQFYQSGRLLQGRRYINYRPNKKITEDTLRATEMVTAVIIRPNECISVKTTLNGLVYLITVSNAIGTPMLSYTVVDDTQQGDHHEE